MVRLGIIGAGICGLMTAYYAYKKGFDVTIYEASDSLGSGASGYNGGVIHVLQTPFNSFKSKLCLEGNLRYKSLYNELGFRIRFLNAYLVYDSIYGRVLGSLVSYYLRTRGYKVSRVNRKVIIGECRELSQSIAGGVRVEGYAVVDPTNVLRSIYKKLSEFNVDIRIGEGVERISIKDDSIELVSRSDTSLFDYIIVAAGVSTRDLMKGLDPKPPEQRFALGVMAVTDLECDAVIARLDVFNRDKYTKGGGIIPTLYKGKTIFGPDFRWVDKPINRPLDHRYGYEVIDKYLDLIDHQPRVLSVYGGTRVINWPDDDFIIKKISGKIIALYGIDSPGFTAAPAIAEYVLNLIL